MKSVSGKALNMKTACLTTIKNNAKSARNAANISLSQLSKMTGYSISALIHFENGKNDSATLLWIYIDYFGLIL